MRGTLVVEDGTTAEGVVFGSRKRVFGELVFNTNMTGYTEALTDPSYRGQILMMTYPLIGNYGVPARTRRDGLDPSFESETIQITGLVVAEAATMYSHRSAMGSLDEWLAEHAVPGLSGVDTRALTKRLREQGVMLGKLVGENDDIPLRDPNKENLVALGFGTAAQLGPNDVWSDATTRAVRLYRDRRLDEALARRGILSDARLGRSRRSDDAERVERHARRVGGLDLDAVLIDDAKAEAIENGQHVREEDALGVEETQQDVIGRRIAERKAEAPVAKDVRLSDEAARAYDAAEPLFDEAQRAFAAGRWEASS